MDEPECQFRIWWSMLVFVHVVSSHNEPETQKRSRKIVLDWIESYDYYQPSRNSQEKPGPSSGINFLILLTDPPLLRDVEYLIWRVRKGSTIDSLMRWPETFLFEWHCWIEMQVRAEKSRKRRKLFAIYFHESWFQCLCIKWLKRAII